MRLTTFIIDLDSLFDTRLPVLLEHCPEWIKHNFKNYLNREQDNFGEHQEVFNTNYNARTKLILKDSVITHMPAFLKEATFAILTNNVDNPHQQQPMVRVNTYPYKDLTDVEITNILTGLGNYLHPQVYLDHVCLPPEELTPKYLKEHCDVLVMYDYNAWFNIHAELKTFERSIAPSVTLQAPVLFPLDRQVIKESKTGKSTILEAEKLASVVIDLKFLEAKYFSIYIKD